ncbi:MAG: type II toxin-antitoxin system VapC family toxin [Nostoc sp. ChiSLP01]|nr:PIN domain-containing protein [Nostoc sp. CmiSLP01]MDZ8288667.1 PIN domain-containing protein [Nostoc sp. ChiSLP01]
MILADTGFFVAIASTKDRYHSLAIAALETINEPIITTYPVITEICYLLLREAGSKVPPRFLNNFIESKDLTIFNLEIIHLQRIAELMETYSDIPMDFADASLVVLAEHLGEGRILSSDRRDFSIYRWQNSRRFSNLMFADS